MKNTNIKILFLSFVLLSVFGLAVTAQAAGDSLYVSPATSTVNAGSNVTVSAIAGTSGDKICAVQGTIVFNNLTCQSITLASGVMAQTQPTCSSPSSSSTRPTRSPSSGRTTSTRSSNRAPSARWTSCGTCGRWQGSTSTTLCSRSNRWACSHRCRTPASSPRIQCSSSTRRPTRT